MTDPLIDINNYSPSLTISQLIKFCEKKGFLVTKGMIQNYIRVGLLPNPVNKRFYTHKHIAALIIVCLTKPVYEIESIKKALLPHMDEEGLPIETYQKIFSFCAAKANAFTAELNEADSINYMTSASLAVGNRAF